jgi:HSP20 family molecular chaperone IbpA
MASALLNQVDALFEDVFGDPLFRAVLATPYLNAKRDFESQRGQLAPAVQKGIEVDKGEKEVTYFFDIPGLPKDSIAASIDTETRILTVTGETETRKASYRVSVTKDADVSGKVKTDFKNGVLSVSFGIATPEEKSTVRQLLS